MPTLGYRLDANTVTQTLTAGDSDQPLSTQTRPAQAFLKALGHHTPFDTGLLPPGTISVRQGSDHFQVVMVAPPGANLINWGEREGDPDVVTYLLAQPYRVIIVDFLAGKLGGARMFYSPRPITSFSQQMYMINVPNSNQRGYNGTGVGWICLYPNENYAGWTIGQMAMRILERCSGVEAYNNRNMYQTDGTRFYKDAGKPRFTWDPAAWDAKTEKEGWQWTLDENLWIPTLVTDIDDQDRHNTTGVPLTLDMAMTGNAGIYYDDTYWPKPINAYARNLPIEGVDLLKKVYQEAFLETPPEVGSGATLCQKCNILLYPGRPGYSPKLAELGYCLACGRSEYAMCHRCRQPVKKAESQIVYGYRYDPACALEMRGENEQKTSIKKASA